MWVLIPLIPAFVFLGSMFLVVGGVLSWKRLHRRDRRSPLVRNLLRSPAESLRARLDDLQIDILGQLLFAGMMPMLMYSIHISQSYFTDAPETPFRIIASVLTGVGASAFMLIKLSRSLALRHRLRLGMEGEMATGQELNRLMRLGYVVFHDIPAEGFNIDHVVVGPSGVFAIETKARAKPVRGNDQARVALEGTTLHFPGWVETQPLEQAQRQAHWLSRWLSSALAEDIPVKPVLCLPGWFVERKSRHPVIVYNGTGSERLFPKIPSIALPEQTIQRIAHQLDQRCRDVEPKSHEGRKPPIMNAA